VTVEPTDAIKSLSFGKINSVSSYPIAPPGSILITLYTLPSLSYISKGEVGVTFHKLSSSTNVLKIKLLGKTY